MGDFHVRRIPIGIGTTVLLVALLLAIVLGGSVGRTSAGEEAHIASGRGLVHLPSGDAIVEVLVVVQPHENEDEQVRRALKEIHPTIELLDDGGGKVQSSNYTTNGLVWATLPVIVNYNAAGAPASIDDQGALERAMASWTAVPTSFFEYVFGGTTTRCPSLYDGCPGAQFFDGNNDVGWDDIPINGVIGVAWHSTDEFDIVLDNANFAWYTGSLPVAPGTFDLETVNLHELGHAAGLGHSSTIAAVMYPSVSPGVSKRTPHQDDADGISSIYPATTPLPTATPTPTSMPTETPTSTPTSSPSATPSPTPAGPDTTPPSVSITSPAWDATVSGELIATINASDDVAVLVVKFWLDDIYQGYDPNAPYSRNWDSTSLADGAHRILVEASDISGNRSWAAVNFTVNNSGDTVPPTVSITSPAWATTVSGELTATINASDDVGVLVVKFWLDGLYQGYDPSDPYSWTWDTTSLADGAHRILVEASDISGNRSWAAVNFTVNNSGDTVPPTVSITSPAWATTVSGELTATINASDDVGVLVVKFWLDGLYQGYDPSAPFSWTWDTTSLANGAHRILVEASDTSGNRSWAAVNFTVNNGGRITSAGSSASPSWAVVVSSSLSSDVNSGASSLELYGTQRMWVHAVTSLITSIINYTLALD